MDFRDLESDLHLAIALAFAFSIALHAVLAAWILARDGSRAAQVFAAANALLALSLGLQAVEFGISTERLRLSPETIQAVFGAQLTANLLTLAIFFHLLATFEQRYRRPPGGLRSWVTHHLARYSHLYVPSVYALVALGGLLYLSNTGGLGDGLGGLRATIGPTSAYIYGFSLWVLCFVMFPARAGQEHLAVPVAGRATLLTSLGVIVGLLMIWHESRPRVTAEVLMPLLHLHSLPVAVFLALVRYEFAFMDRFVLGTLRTLVWAVIALGAYWVFHRVPIFASGLDPVVLSVMRIGILLLAMAVAPWVGHRVCDFADRVIFGRRVSAEALRRQLARRVAEGHGLPALVEAFCGDVAMAVRARGVRAVVGDRPEGSEPVQLRVPLQVGETRVGTLLLGDRRDLLPYFDGERRLLSSISPLIAGIVAGLRAHPVFVVDARARKEPELSSDSTTTPSESKRPKSPAATLSDRWQSDVLTAAASVGETDPPAAQRILLCLERAASHLKSGGARHVRLAVEMEFARDLLALEALRRRYRFESSVHYPSSLNDQAVPRGVALRLMSKIVSTPLDAVAAGLVVELSARMRDQRVEVAFDAGGSGSMRADFAKRTASQAQTA